METTIQHLRDLIHHLPIQEVALPDEEDLNTIYLQHGSNGIRQIIQSPDGLEELEEVGIMNIALTTAPLNLSEGEIFNNRTNKNSRLDSEEENPSKKPTSKPKQPIIKNKKHFGTADENWNNRANDFINRTETKNETQPIQNSRNGRLKELEQVHDNKLLFKTELNHYAVLGMLPHDLSSMRITLMIEEVSTSRKERTKIDLYEREALKILSTQIAELFSQTAEQIERDLLSLTDLLENHRDKQLLATVSDYTMQRQSPMVSSEQQKRAIEFLKQPDLIKDIDKLIETAGVMGEENTRKLLFIIASTFKMTTPLHALVQGSSGSGKSHLINHIGQCLPPEDVMSMTRVTSKSFYHYTKNQLVDKLLLIQDFDGLDEEAQYAFRELQSAGNISSSTTYKDRSGNIVSAIKQVRSHFASLLATTKAEIYYDNMSRSVVIGVDESEEQTLKIITYQNKRLSGLIDQREEYKAKLFLQNTIRCLKPYEVVNYYADKIKLPIEAKMLRRLNSHYQAFVKQITILHQYQRKKDEQGRLIAETQDLKIACDILFDAIILKVDDLDSSLRQFFDRMKTFVKDLSKQTEKPPTETLFTQREIRLALNASKSQCFRYMEDLELLEYVQKTGGYANRGFKYKIVFWDDMQTTREKIKSHLNEQLDKLENEQNEKCDNESI